MGIQNEQRQGIGRHPSDAALRAALTAELEAARSAFHLLLNSVADSFWETRAVESAWTVKEEMWHIAWGMQFMADLVRNARRRIGLPRPPMHLAHAANALYARLRAGSATPQTVADRYDRTHAAVLRLLDETREGEWDRSVRVFGKRQTVRELFQGISHHFDEHARRVRPLLGLE